MRAKLAIASISVLAAVLIEGNALPPITLGPGQSITINGPLAPLLTITAVSMTPASPKQGDHVYFSAVMKNQGTATAPANSSIGFAVDGVLVGYVNDPAPLAPGASVTLTATNYWVAP